MGEQNGDLSGRQSISIGSADGVTARRWFRAGLLKWCLLIFMAILLGLVQGIRAHAVVIWKVQGTPGANKTTGTNGKKGEAGTRTRAAGPCAGKEKRYVDCGNGTVTDTATRLIWLKQPDCLASAS